MRLARDRSTLPVLPALLKRRSSGKDYTHSSRRSRRSAALDSLRKSQKPPCSSLLMTQAMLPASSSLWTVAPRRSEPISAADVIYLDCSTAWHSCNQTTACDFTSQQIGKQVQVTTEEILASTALNSWKLVIGRVNEGIASLDEEQLQRPVAPGKNRLLYLLGHLTVTHDR